MKKTQELKLKGALKLESRVIKALKIISIFAFLLSTAMQYIFPMVFSTYILEAIHYEFIINVLLGTACSASISLICLWIPFISRRENQYAKLKALAKKLFLDYIRIIIAIDSNSERNNTENTFLGEFHLISVAKELEQDTNELIYEYEKSDIVSKNIKAIIDKENTVFLPISQITAYFVNLLMPEEYKKNPNDLLSLNKNKAFDKAENEALYNQLRLSLDEIISYKDMLDLFSGYINPNYMDFEISGNGMEQLKNIQKYCQQKKVFNIQNDLFIKVITLQEEFWKKHAEIELQKLNMEEQSCKQKRN